MKQIALLIFTFSSLYGLGQGKKFYQLQYKTEPYYTESNQFQNDSVWRFKQTVTHDLPNMFDEQSWTTLEIIIHDSATFLKRRVLELKEDNLVAKHNFTTNSVWDSRRDSTAITGYIQLFTITPEGITLRLNLVVTNLKTQDQFVYTGERLFVKPPSLMEFLNSNPSFKHLYDSIKAKQPPVKELK